jgi:7,8-dihydropterin-6-yl-methyl-4-(beta-D-ribofuranosyl)aminobenzene 5'-phosphate synthase
MKVVVLIDNSPHPKQELFHEHGLSIYFEADGYKWLMDVGATGKFASNAKNMGIDISDIDSLILSHGHADHTGGLDEFLKLNKKAKVYVSPLVLSSHFYSLRHGSKRNISSNKNIIENHLKRFVFVTENRILSDNVALICQISEAYPKPMANNGLLISNEEHEGTDEFKHEMVLAIRSKNGVNVFSGCSHNGLLNILKTSSDFFSQLPINQCIGGTHLLSSDEIIKYETMADVKLIASTIKNLFPAIKLISGHCTGFKATEIFASELGNRFQNFHAGWTSSMD